MKDELKRVYLFFLRKLSTFNELEFNEKDIDSFLKRLGKKMDLVPLGEQFAWDYVSFQFCYWAEKKHIRRRGQYPSSWIFGEKALKRWEERGENWSFFVDDFLGRMEIVRPMKYFGADFSEVWEEERKRFYNTEEGYVNCLLNSKYDSHSLLCNRCKFSKTCRDGERNL
jgi:hypothetical protein